jgi:hypothetical protein
VADPEEVRELITATQTALRSLQDARSEAWQLAQDGDLEDAAYALGLRRERDLMGDLRAEWDALMAALR